MKAPGSRNSTTLRPAAIEPLDDLSEVSMAKVLVIDDEQPLCWAMKKVLEREGHEVHIAGTAAEGLRIAEVEEPEVILLDVRLPDADGLDVLESLRGGEGRAEIVIMTAHGTMETAVTAMRRGAYDYLAKPVDPDQARAAVSRAARVRALSAEVFDLKARIAARPASMMVGSTQRMQEVFKKIGVASLSDAPVLLLGETGTGKDLVARAVHEASGRKAGPFVPVHCAAIPETLIESELFGVERGAFTGALQSRAGRIARADGGTLFLDEVGEIPQSVQVKLLRVLEEGSVEELGASKPRKVDFRVISATNADLHKAVSEGRFREDLFFRLNVFPLSLPPLRERAEDIPLLVDHFLACSPGRGADVSAEAMRALQSFPWPGNVRELKNAVEHAVALARGRPILPEHLPKGLCAAASGTVSSLGSLREQVARAASEGREGLYEEFLPLFEKPLLAEILNLTGGNQVKAAAMLGIHRTTLRKKIERYKL